MSREKYTTVEEYLAAFPLATQQILNNLRQIVKAEAPSSIELISYQILEFKLNGKYLIYFAAYEHHIGCYPVHSEGTGLEEVLKAYASGKASLRFPLSKPIPYELIRQVIRLKISQIN